MIKSRPDIHLSAETGGKDATIVTALADRDQAVKNVVASAFNNSGQKCSATSLLVLERELFEDEGFKRMLVDAASSLEVGSVWKFKNRIGALVRPPEGNLETALSTLDAHEEWALAPSYADGNNPCMLRPSIRWGTRSGDFCHMNELFGPVLSVLCADDLLDAIEIVNATGYGLTSGLESLDEREQALWKEKLLAGNLYINRVTTGAIVQRQPFGGMRKSAIGSGRKAGGLNYVSQFMKLSFKDGGTQESAEHPFIGRLKALSLPKEIPAAIMEETLKTAGSFAYWLEKEFLTEHDYARVRGENNLIRYLPVKSVLLRFEENDSLYTMLSSVAAAKMAGAELHISIPREPASRALIWLRDNSALLLDKEERIAEEDEAALLSSMARAERIRFLRPENVSGTLYELAAESALYIASEPFIGHGRIELMHYFIEQSISNSYHRYGNLGLQGLSEKEA
jgi:RHH-type proline utilization regulon transcriptional repressor/proline dehydrogenase/delta 1-pyrroline-5-carboxylate dehydrogenase